MNLDKEPVRPTVISGEPGLSRQASVDNAIATERPSILGPGKAPSRTWRLVTVSWSVFPAEESRDPIPLQPADDTNGRGSPQEDLQQHASTARVQIRVDGCLDD